MTWPFADAASICIHRTLPSHSQRPACPVTEIAAISAALHCAALYEAPSTRQPAYTVHTCTVHFHTTTYVRPLVHTGAIRLAAWTHRQPIAGLASSALAPPRQAPDASSRRPLDSRPSAMGCVPCLRFLPLEAEPACLQPVESGIPVPVRPCPEKAQNPPTLAMAHQSPPLKP